MKTENYFQKYMQVVFLQILSLLFVSLLIIFCVTDYTYIDILLIQRHSSFSFNISEIVMHLVTIGSFYVMVKVVLE